MRSELDCVVGDQVTCRTVSLSRLWTEHRSSFCLWVSRYKANHAVPSLIPQSSAEMLDMALTPPVSLRLSWAAWSSDFVTWTLVVSSGRIVLLKQCDTELGPVNLE